MLAKCAKIAEHGISCFVNRQLVYNLAEQYFADHGIAAIEHADFEGVERLALVTGGDIVSTFDNPSKVRLGHCKLIEEVLIGENKFVRFSGVARGEACTIVLRGPGQQLLDEAQRALHDALSVLSQALDSESGGCPRTVFGAGASEMLMAHAVDELAKRTAGKKAIAIEAFARALRHIPAIIADNAGLDSTELVAQLRARHAQGDHTAGLDITRGAVGDVRALGVVESLRVKRQVLLSASEAAEMILRIDEVIRAAPRKREHDPRYG
jgi:T-complex protein 1 subunit beta